MLDGDLVGAVVVVAVGRELAVDEIVDDQTGLVPHRVHRRVLDGGQRVGDDAQTGDAAGQRAQDGAVVQRHLERS